jgi:ubiquitin-conjugating enzyme E2 Z
MASTLREEYTSSVLTPIAQKRLIRDISHIYRNPLTDHGIYYKHSDSDMTVGYAMIIGPTDTPYENGIYLFKFKFPYNYPAIPPHVTYHTNNGYTRFHPNLYKNGKVCLSILNTWQGESWSSCQSISSVLLTISSILTKEALTHEPGISSTHQYTPIYEEIIKYENISSAICNIINCKSTSFSMMELFKSEIINHLTSKRDDIYSLAKRLITESQNNHGAKNYVLSINFYQHMKSKIDYASLLERLDELYESIEN